MLIDRDLTAARAYGVVNERAGRVPHPTVVIVDKEGVIRFFHLDENYRRRPKPETIVEALQEIVDVEANGSE